MYCLTLNLPHVVMLSDNSSLRVTYTHTTHTHTHTHILGDNSASDNADSAVVDERIRLILDTQDPKLVSDLRQDNPGRPPKYEAFWEECRKYLAEEVDTAVDERRHGEVSHLSKALSVRDLLDQVSARCPEGVSIPCKQWLRLQFWPKNPTT